MMTNDDTITKAQEMETSAAQTPAADNNKSGRTAAVGVGAGLAGAALGAADCSDARSSPTDTASTRRLPSFGSVSVVASAGTSNACTNKYE